MTNDQTRQKSKGKRQKKEKRKWSQAPKFVYGTK
jgi:hypothetical protein